MTTPGKSTAPAASYKATLTAILPVPGRTPGVRPADRARLVVSGGFQLVEAYDVLIANLDPTLHREPPQTPGTVAGRFSDGLTSQCSCAATKRPRGRPRPR